MIKVPLTLEQKTILVSLGKDNVRMRLIYAGAGPGSIVPRLGDGMMLRGDVEVWLAEQDRLAAVQAGATLFWACIAAVATILIGIGAVQHYWH